MSKEKKGVSPSDAGQVARTVANKKRNVSRAKEQIDKALNRRKDFTPHGTARSTRRGAARAAWIEQAGKTNSKPLSAFCS